MKKRSTLYGMAVGAQAVILALEFISFLTLLLVNPANFKDYLKFSHIPLTASNKIFLSLLGIFQSVPSKIVGAFLLAGLFLFLIIYFVIVNKIASHPSRHALIFFFITLISTAFFCFTAINFWQVYSRFM